MLCEYNQCFLRGSNCQIIWQLGRGKAEIFYGITDIKT